MQPGGGTFAGTIGHGAAPRAAAQKVKRIRRNPAVRVAACTASGRLRGEQLAGVAELLPDPEAGPAEQLLRRKYRFDMLIIGPLRAAQSALHLGRPRAARS